MRLGEGESCCGVGGEVNAYLFYLGVSLRFKGWLGVVWFWFTHLMEVWDEGGWVGQWK